MFQFRAFPSYAYLIQRTILEYCSSGFPHSEISGSTDICSSPKLIAACHVLRRLLMPRHSPCALYSLTLRDILVLLFGIMQAINRLLSQNCNCYPHLFRCSTIKIHNFSSTSVETFCCLAFITFQYIVQFSRCNYSFRVIAVLLRKTAISHLSIPARPLRGGLYVALRAPLNRSLALKPDLKT